MRYETTVILTDGSEVAESFDEYDEMERIEFRSYLQAQAEKRHNLRAEMLG